MTVSVSVYTCTAILLAALAIWLRLVDQVVPQPYLDEVFHIPQAQQYCAGQWNSWDPKITTPPGLYIIAAVLNPIFGCSTTTLRIENAVCLLLLFYSLQSSIIRGREDVADARRYGTTAHIALNSVLFPPLFFFAALYYTDVPSTLSVVLFLNSRKSPILLRQSVYIRVAVLYALGLWTLLFRQTNIFWVAIYPAALTVVEYLDEGYDVARGLVRDSMHNFQSGFGDTWYSIVKTSWKFRVVYNPPVDTAFIDDYLKCLASIAACLAHVLVNGTLLGSLLAALAPYIALLSTFVIFVILNGSVVLGDKSNHVATLHLAQMLYVWPYIIFFSWPSLLPYASNFLLRLLQRPSDQTVAATKEDANRQESKLPRLGYVISLTLLSAVVVRYNTIIHPFTLADNRHYTFYVFRLLMRPWWMRYAVIPVYVFGAWLCIQAMGLRTPRELTRPQSRSSRAIEHSAVFVLIWCLTTALQLITAPLVEPRYFILPWLVWRLNIPAEQQTSLDQQSQGQTNRLMRATRSIRQQILWLETIWYLTITAITAYLFLQRGFTWPSEPGKIQRFMW